MNQENQVTANEAPSVTVNQTVTTAGSTTVVVKCGGCGVMYSIPAPAPEQDPTRIGTICPKCQHKQPLMQAAGTPVKRDKVAIVGFADSWPMAPFSHPGWEVWALNQFYDLTGGLVGGRINFTDLAKEKRLRWFEIHARHDLECDPNVIARHAHHLQRLREIGAMGAPVYMHQVWPDIPNSVEYPLKAMTDRFGGYWTNSISYMIALAIAEGFREIGLYGVNMAMDSEWGFQRPSCEYFIGFARGAGITVHVPPQSDLLGCPFLYGYEDEKANKFQAKIDQLLTEHQQRMVAHARTRDENEAHYQQFNGAIQQLQVVKRMANIGK